MTKEDLERSVWAHRQTYLLLSLISRSRDAINLIERAYASVGAHSLAQLSAVRAEMVYAATGVPAPIFLGERIGSVMLEINTWARWQTSSYSLEYMEPSEVCVGEFTERLVISSLSSSRSL